MGLAGLAQKLEDIDAGLVCDTNRRQLARAPVSLPWPAHNPVVAPVPAPRPVPPASRLARLRKAAAEAAEAAELARCQYVASQRSAERVKRIVEGAVAAQREVLGRLCPRKLLTADLQLRELKREGYPGRRRSMMRRLP